MIYTGRDPQRPCEKKPGVTVPMALKPPTWLMVVVNIISVISLVTLIMYLVDRMECNKFVRLNLAMQVAVVLLALFAYWDAGGFGK